MTTRKVMRGAELRRIGNDLVLTDRYPDGTTQTLARPIEEWLIIKAWIEELSEDHDAAVAPDPHPSPESEPETGEAGGCTRTAPGYSLAGRFHVVYDPTELDEDEVYRHLAQLGIDGEVTIETVVGLPDGPSWPVSAIADGEVRRA